MHRIPMPFAGVSRSGAVGGQDGRRATAKLERFAILVDLQYSLRYSTSVTSPVAVNSTSRTLPFLSFPLIS